MPSDAHARLRASIKQRRRKVCSVNGCGDDIRTREWCSMHYLRWLKGRSLTAPSRLTHRSGGPCEVDGCPTPSKNKGLCRMHYQRRRKGQNLTAPTRYGPKRGMNLWVNDITYNAAHQRVRQEFGLAKNFACVECGEAAHHWAYDGTDPTELLGRDRDRGMCWYSRYPEFYMPLCRRCHGQRDGAIRKAELAEFRQWKMNQRKQVA